VHLRHHLLAAGVALVASLGIGLGLRDDTRPAPSALAGSAPSRAAPAARTRPRALPPAARRSVSQSLPPSVASQGSPPPQRLEVERGDFEGAVARLNALAAQDPEEFERLAWALARDPSASIELQVGVYGAAETLPLSLRTALWLQLTKTLTRSLEVAEGLEATQRDDLGRGLVALLAEQGQRTLLTRELFAGSVDRTWIAAALDSQGWLFGPQGLTLEEQLQLGTALAEGLQRRSNAGDRLALIATLEPPARRRGVLSALEAGAHPELEAGVAELVTQLVEEGRADAELQSELLDSLALRLRRAQATDLWTRVRLASAYARLLPAGGSPAAQLVSDELERAVTFGEGDELRAAALRGLSALPPQLRDPALDRLRRTGQALPPLESVEWE